jgi:hypothetical protein
MKHYLQIKICFLQKYDFTIFVTFYPKKIHSIPIVMHRKNSYYIRFLHKKDVSKNNRIKPIYHFYRKIKANF